MKKSKLKKLLDKAFEELQLQKGRHSKVMKLNYSKLKMQKYLRANIKRYQSWRSTNNIQAEK